jgi:hypothetical protein
MDTAFDGMLGSFQDAEDALLVALQRWTAPALNAAAASHLTVESARPAAA